MYNVEQVRQFIEPMLEYDGELIESISKKLHVSKNFLEQIIRFLPGVFIEGNRIVVKDRLLLAIYGLRLGLPAKRLSKYLSWSDFEKLSAQILSSHGYLVYTNLRLTKPKRLEIDVIGIDIGPGRSIVIDCKHWKYGISPSSLLEVGRKHINRVITFLRYASWVVRKYPYISKIKYAIPVIVTFTTPKIRQVDHRAVIININELNNFLQDIHLVLDELNVKPINLDDVLKTNTLI